MKAYTLTLLFLCIFGVGLGGAGCSSTEEYDPTYDRQRRREVSPFIDGIKKELGEKKKSSPAEDRAVVDPYIQQLRKETQKHIDPHEPEPYIKELRAALQKSEGEVKETSFIDELKLAMAAEQAVDLETLEADQDRSFIEEVKQDPKYLEESKAAEAESYTSKLKKDLPAEVDESAIRNLHEGKSELKFERKGEIRHAISLRIGTILNTQIKGENTPQDFTTVYGGGWQPNLHLSYEFQLFHSEYLGSLGLILTAGYATFSGTGKFRYTLTDVSGNEFTSESRTTFDFKYIPTSLGANYRFNLFRFVRPYAHLAATNFIYVESRSDGVQSKKGMSQGLRTSFGAAILLDWIHRESTWNLYTDAGVLHYYLTVEYERLTHLRGKVEFETSALFSGFTFEF